MIVAVKEDLQTTDYILFGALAIRFPFDIRFYHIHFYHYPYDR